MQGFDARRRHQDKDGDWNGPVVDFSDKEDVMKYFRSWAPDNQTGVLLTSIVGDIFDAVIDQGYQEGKTARSHEIKALLEL